MQKQTVKDPYRTSRVLYIFEALVEYLSSLLVTGTFLASLTSELGISDSITGLITAFVSLGCGFQMLSVFISRKNGVKKKVILFALINEILFTFVYVTPFLEINSTVKTVIFIVCMMLGNVLLNVGNAPKISWFMSLVDDGKRGIFTSVKQMISLGSGMLFSFIMGNVIDNCKAQGNIKKGLIIAAISLFVLMVLHALTLIFSKEKPAESEIAAAPVGKRMRELIRNKGFLRAVLVCVFWNITQQMLMPFLGTYQIKELGFSLSFSAAIAMVYSVTRIIFEPLLGRFADKRSFEASFRLCVLIMSGATVMIVLAPINAPVFYVIFNILRGIAGAGINSALMNMVFDYVPHSLRSDALSLKNTLYGFTGFFTALAVTPIVSAIQSNGFSVFGLELYAQQVLAVISAVLLLLLSIFVERVIMKKKKA